MVHHPLGDLGSFCCYYSVAIRNEEKLQPYSPNNMFLGCDPKKNLVYNTTV